MEQITPEIKTSSRAIQWFTIFVIALISGLVGGYFAISFDSALLGGYSVSEISSDIMGRGRPIIREAKNVIIEQNDKTVEIADNLRQNLLAIVDKPQSKSGWQQMFYSIDKVRGELLPLTSDGWLITSFSGLADENGRISSNYAIINQTGESYEVQKVIKDRFTDMYFVKIKARSLPVTKLAKLDGLRNGQVLVASNWQGQVSQAIQTSRSIGTSTVVKYSDELTEEIIATPAITGKFFVFMNLKGEIAGLASTNGKIISSRTVNMDMYGLLNASVIVRPSFGFYFLNMNRLINIDPSLRNENKIGLLIYKDGGTGLVKSGPADNAGLRDRDVLTAIDGVAPTADFADKIIDYRPGEELSVSVNRMDNPLNVKIKIGTQK